MLRILFITTKIGYGHERVSHILADAVCESIPDCKIKIVTYFDFFPKRFQAAINSLYVFGLRWFPRFFAYLYLKQKKYKGSGFDFWYRVLGRRYAFLIKMYSPDFIIITQGLACQWLGRLKEKKLVKVPLIAVITDFIAHPFWISQEINLYLVANIEIKNDLAARGIEKDKIAVTGMPIDPRFSLAYDKDEIKDKLILNKDWVSVLIMGGGWGLGSMGRVVSFLSRLRLPMQLIIVTGRNRKLYRVLKNKKFESSVHVFGKMDNVCELMAVSDLIITKSGGVTVSEILASGLPAVLWDIIPGQEEANAEYLVKNGAAIKAKNINEIKDAVSELVLSKKKREEMRLLSKKLGRPDSASLAVRQIKELTHA